MKSKAPVGAKFFFIPGATGANDPKAGSPGKQPQIWIGGCQPPPPILPQPPNYDALSDAQIQEISGKGGAGIAGHGTLEGTIVARAEGLLVQAVLVTSGRGTADEVRFNLNNKPSELTEFMGQRVKVEGNIDKTTDTVGRIGAAQISKANSMPAGTYTTLKGAVAELQASFTPGAPPSGNYLVLDKAIEVDGQTYSRIHLGYADFDSGPAELHGRVDVKPNGATGTYLSLSGISDIAKGQPKFDGQQFTTVDGKSANKLILERRSIADAPDVILVPDQGGDVVHEGRFGGMRMPGSNPFSGFTGKTYSLDNPSPAERNAIQSVMTDGVKSADGRQLAVLFSQSEGTVNPRGMTWAYDGKTETAYRIRTQGGFVGVTGSVDQVIRGIKIQGFVPPGLPN